MLKIGSNWYKIVKNRSKYVQNYSNRFKWIQRPTPTNCVACGTTSCMPAIQALLLPRPMRRVQFMLEQNSR